jgi:cyclase
MQATRLSDNVLAIGGDYVEEHLTVVASGDGLIVVDTLATLPATREALPLIRTFSAEPVRVVINTHLDADHIAGNAAFAGAAIVAHANGVRHLDERFFDDGASEQGIREFVKQLRSNRIPDDPQLAARRQTYIDMYTRLLDGFGDFVPAPPFLFVSSDARVVLGRVTLELKHFGPAHTDADLVVFLPAEGLVLAGDVAMGAGVVPIAHPVNGGSLVGLARALQAIDSLITETSRIVPGHGSIGGPALVRQQRDYVESLLEAIRDAQARGATLEDARPELEVPAFSRHLMYDLVHPGHVDLAWRELLAHASGQRSHASSSS